MRRVGGLWPELISFPNLLKAALMAARGKRNRPDVARFLLNMETEIIRLQRRLAAFEYQPGPYRTFHVREPKPRLISAAPFRDRVVHHALTQILEPIFERRFTKDSYACRKGYGTHRALQRAAEGCRRYAYVLKCDVRKFFPSIDHEILKELLGRVIKCRPTLDLASLIIDASNPQEDAVCYYPGDTLFTPFERRRGLPLGNQTSQFFANVYLNPLDHFVVRELRPAMYVRYVDDFLLFSDNKRDLNVLRQRIEERLDGLRLRIHPGKSRAYLCRDGVTFLGWRLFPHRLRLVRGNVVRFRRRMKAMRAAYAAGAMEWPEITMRVRAWIAHAGHGQTFSGHTWTLRTRLFSRYSFSRSRERG